MLCPSSEYESSSVYSSGSSLVLPNTTLNNFVTLNKCPQTILTVQILSLLDSEVSYYEHLRTLIEVHRYLHENVSQFNNLSTSEVDLIFRCVPKFAEISRSIVEEIIHEISCGSDAAEGFRNQDREEDKVRYILRYSNTCKFNVSDILDKHLLNNQHYVGALLELRVRTELVEQLLDNSTLEISNSMKWKQVYNLANLNGVDDLKHQLKLPLEHLRQLRQPLKIMMDHVDEPMRFNIGLSLIKTNRLIDKCESQAPAATWNDLQQWYRAGAAKAALTYVAFLGKGLEPDSEVRMEGTKVKQIDITVELFKMISRFASRQRYTSKIYAEVDRYTLEVKRFVRSQQYFAPIWKQVLGGDAVFDQIYDMFCHKMCDLEAKSDAYIYAIRGAVLRPLAEMNMLLAALSQKVDNYRRAQRKSKKNHPLDLHKMKQALARDLNCFLQNCEYFVQLIVAQIISCTCEWLHNVIGPHKIQTYKALHSNRASSSSSNHDDIIEFHGNALAASLLG